MYGWIASDTQGKITHISVKQSLQDPTRDPIVLGAFTFKDPAHFWAALQRMQARDGRIKGEFYLDTCVNDALALGMRCVVMEVQHFLSWGTPNDLRTFEYWQSCFDAWPSHPYSIAQDAMVPAAEKTLLRERYHAFSKRQEEELLC